MVSPPPSPPPLCLNCLTRAAVPTSPWWDGWLPARLRSTCVHTSCVLTLPLNVSCLLSLPSTSPCFLVVCALAVLVCVSAPPETPPSLFLSAYLSLSSPQLQSIVCQSNMWQVVRVKKKKKGSQSEVGRKSTVTKAPSPELACSCKNTSITSMIE